MKKISSLSMLALALIIASCKSNGNHSSSLGATSKNNHLFIDVHNLEPGKVPVDAVAQAHQKDLKTQGKYGVNILKYWIDQQKGKVYCLAESSDSASLYKTHKEAHGLVPQSIREVKGGVESASNVNGPWFLDVHQLGASVNFEAVAKAHERDLAVQSKYGANFVNYWVDEQAGTVMCLVKAADSASIANAHKEAHGLLPKSIRKVNEGN